MPSKVKRIALALLACIYIAGCQSTILRLAEYWYSTAADRAYSQLHSGPAKSLPHVSWAQHRTHLPLMPTVALADPVATFHTNEVPASVVPYPGPPEIQCDCRPSLFTASDPSPPPLYLHT
jgi:hypothetical protein